MLYFVLQNRSSGFHLIVKNAETRICFGFVSLRYATGLRVRHVTSIVIQSEVKQIQSWLSRTRFPALCVSHVFALSFDWFFHSIVNDRSDYFGFGFTTLICKPLY